MLHWSVCSRELVNCGQIWHNCFSVTTNKHPSEPGCWFVSKGEIKIKEQNIAGWRRLTLSQPVGEACWVPYLTCLLPRWVKKVKIEWKFPVQYFKIQHHITYKLLFPKIKASPNVFIIWLYLLNCQVIIPLFVYFLLLQFDGMFVCRIEKLW